MNSKIDIYSEDTDIYKNRTLIKDILTSSSKDEFVLCGRVLSIRQHSNVTFFEIRDVSGIMQAAIFKTSSCIEDVKDIVVGAIVLIKGKIFITSTKNLCIDIAFIQLLSLPNKGFTKKCFGAENKILNSIVNEEYASIFRKRNLIIKLVRQFLGSHNFEEMETPVLQVVPSGGDNIHTFDTFHNAFKQKMYLRVAPECFLKRMIVAGWERIFELARCFRNEGISYKHNPEFMLLEVYQAYSGLDDVMNLVEELIDFLLVSLNIESVNIKRISFLDIVSLHLNQDSMLISISELQSLAESESTERMVLLEKVFEDYISDNIIEPTFVCYLPAASAPLARISTFNPLLAERAELYIQGMEVSNLCVELRDAEKQRQLIENTLGDDRAFLDDLSLAMPPLAGFGIGMDRLILFLLKSKTIRDNMMFA